MIISKFLSVIDPRWWQLKKRFCKNFSGPLAEVNSNGYVIAVISRGEQLLYEDVLGQVKFEMSFSENDIDASVLDKLESKRRRKIVLNRVLRYFKVIRQMDIKVSH